MDHIYILNLRNDKKHSQGSLIYQKGQKLYHAIVEKHIEHNQIHRVLKQSFEYCTIKNGDSPLMALFKYGRVYSEHNSNAKGYRLNRINVRPGFFYPRINRPFIEKREDFSIANGTQIERLKEEVFKYPDFFPHNFRLQLIAVNQLGALKEMLLSILNTIHPSTKNLNSFGQSIKNLLVLSCIEVEAQLKGIYKANEISSKNNYSTKDYVKLKDIMQLDKYKVRLPYYPDLKIISPFKKWSAHNSTKSLIWYDSYNAIKHNGEIDFEKATLENAISAFCAVAVLLKAQYGDYIPFWDEKIGGIIEVTNNIAWKIEEMILAPLTKNNWTINKIGL